MRFARERGIKGEGSRILKMKLSATGFVQMWQVDNHMTISQEHPEYHEQIFRIVISVDLTLASLRECTAMILRC